MARAGMADLILEMRRLTNAGTADYTVNGTSYYTDDQLQSYLDRNRQTHKQIPLYAIADYSGGTFSYTEYPLPEWARWIEQNETGSGWSLEDTTGGSAPSYTVNYDARMVTFAADTEDLTYYLDFRTYDMNMAVAEVYESKASFVVTAVDWSSDNHSVKASQEYSSYMSMAKFWRSKSGGTHGKFIRSDEVMR